MWLDRFSGHNTPSQSPLPWNRSSSPAPPRKSLHLTPNALPRRPGLPQRVSSWSGLTNGSSDSLPAIARQQGVSSLRSQLDSAATNSASDPLNALLEILDSGDSGITQGQRIKSTNRQADLVEDIDFDGLSLQDFAKAPLAFEDTEIGSDEPLSKDFEGEKDRFEELHRSIAACDEVLASVERNLTSFQADLAAVSAEIETLQTRSTSLDVRLKTRKDVDRLLGPEVDALSLSPTIVRKITEGKFDDHWIKALHELEKRSKSLEAKSRTGENVKAAQDLRPFLDSLKDRAVERIRDHVVSQIRGLRVPGVNAQLVQHNALSKYKDAFAFLAKHQPQLEENISQAYINTMRWYYVSNFTRYKTALDKLSLHVIDKNDTLAQDEAAKRGPALNSANRAAGPRDPFSLGRRIELLRSSAPHALPSHVAEEDKATHFLETPFRAFNLALVDNASAEFSFLTEFFSKSSIHVISRRFMEIFEPTLALGQRLTKQLVEPTVDALGVLMCVRLNQHFAFELQRRKVSTMEGYINGTSMLLWPRFQMLMDLHCDSLRKATAALPGKPAGSALSLTSSADTHSVAPHAVTQRFSNLVQGILVLSTEAGDDEPVQRSLGRLRDDFLVFLVKLSKGIADAKKRERFLFNNYSLIGTIINETEGKMADELKAHFTELRSDLAGR